MAVVIAAPGALKVGLARLLALCWRYLHAQAIGRAAFFQLDLAAALGQVRDVCL